MLSHVSCLHSFYNRKTLNITNWHLPMVEKSYVGHTATIERVFFLKTFVVLMFLHFAVSDFFSGWSLSVSEVGEEGGGSWEGGGGWLMHCRQRGRPRGRQRRSSGLKEYVSWKRLELSFEGQGKYKSNDFMLSFLSLSCKYFFSD